MPKSSPVDLTSTLEYLDSHRDQFRITLESLSRIPSVSAEGFPPEEVARSAEATCEAMRAVGLETSRC